MSIQVAEKFFSTLHPKVIKSTFHEVQYDFFLDRKESDIECLRREFSETRDSTNRVRKKLFAENSSLKKRVLDLESRLEHIERGLCRPSQN